MITISCDLGEFTIDVQEITTDDDFLKYLFDSVYARDDIEVYEGDVDRALGLRMMKYLSNTKIKEFKPTKQEKGIVY